MEIRISQALAHFRQLLALGADYDQALRDTQIAYDLDCETVDMLAECYEYDNAPLSRM